MRRSKIPAWPRAPRPDPVIAEFELLQLAAVFVKRHGDAFIPFFEIVEAEVQTRQRLIDAKRRAFTLVINNDRPVGRISQSPYFPGEAA